MGNGRIEVSIDDGTATLWCLSGKHSTEDKPLMVIPHATETEIEAGTTYLEQGGLAGKYAMPKELANDAPKRKLYMLPIDLIRARIDAGEWEAPPGYTPQPERVSNRKEGFLVKHQPGCATDRGIPLDHDEHSRCDCGVFDSMPKVAVGECPTHAAFERYWTSTANEAQVENSHLRAELGEKDDLLLKQYAAYHNIAMQCYDLRAKLATVMTERGEEREVFEITEARLQNAMNEVDEITDELAAARHNRDMAQSELKAASERTDARRRVTEKGEG